MDELRGRAAGDPSLADVRHVVAYEYGFESWAALDEALAQPPERTPDPRLGRSASPPFYRIDPDRNTLEARPPLTDGDWETIFPIMKERGLTGIKAAAIGDGAISRLSRLDFVTRLDIGGPALSDDGLLHLAGMPQLEELSLAGRVTDRGFKTWREREIGCDLMTFAPEANNLLLDGPITDRGLAGLAGLDGLFGLGLFWHAHAFTGAGLAALSVLPNLRFLACPGEGCDDAAMGSIATLPKLRMLLAQGTIASDDGFVALSRCRSLEYLWGRECPNLQGRGFRALASMPALRGLGVSCKLVDDASLAALADFRSLRQLMPMDVTDDGFRHVGACEGLVDLWCMYCRETGDEATEHIAGLTLKTYYAGKTGITDRSCEILGRMGSLELVELWETAGVTDAGLTALAKLPRLRRFTVTGAPRVARVGLAAFPPAVRIDYAS